MDIIKTGIEITKTIKNVTRFREILSVFARHGFDQLIIKSKLHSKIPNFVIPKSRFKEAEAQSEYDFWKSVGYRLRKSFEELGPTFIKMGQLLATREDILNPALISQLKLLQNKAEPIDFSLAKDRIEKEMGGTLSQIFLEFNEIPIGVASIATVYKAKLKNGSDVVVKVRRPKIKNKIINDFEIMSFVVQNLEKASKEFRFLGMSRAIDDFFKSIQLELNFLIEANNNKTIKKNLEKIDSENLFVIPNIHRDISTQKVLVMDFLDGTPFTEITDITAMPELKTNLTKAVKMFLHTMLADGFFHADLHGGNFFHLKDDKIGLIDFGLVGTLNKKNRTNLIAILYALLSNNYENLVYEFLDVAEFDVIPDTDLLIKDIRDGLSPYVGLSVQEMDATALMHSIVSSLSKHEIYLPREWFVIFRALMTLDGVGKSLNLDLNIFEVIDSEIKDIMGELISKDALIEDAAWLGRDIVNSLRVVPRQLKWMIKEFSKKKYILDIQLAGTNKQINFLTRSVYFLSLMILTATFFACGVYVIAGYDIQSFNEVPIVSYLCWGLSLLAFIRGSIVFKIR